MKRVLLALPLLCMFVFAGCPTTGGGMVLGGDPQLVGTWEGNVSLQGVQAHSQLTFDGSGNYGAIVSAVQGNAATFSSGKWYVNTGAGYLNMQREWFIPETAGTIGTFRDLYEVNGDVLEIWNNPINMDRPTSRETAALHQVLYRKINKSIEDTAIAGTFAEAL